MHRSATFFTNYHCAITKTRTTRPYRTSPHFSHKHIYLFYSEGGEHAPQRNAIPSEAKVRRKLERPLLHKTGPNTLPPTRLKYVLTLVIRTGAQRQPLVNYA